MKTLDTQTKELSPSELEVQKNSLRRLQTLVDVVYGLMLFRLFLLFPNPTQEQLDNRDFIGMFAESGTQLLIILIGITLIIIYWGQNVRQLGNLNQIDSKIATLAIVQLFTFLLYLYFMRLDNETDGDEFTLLMQSIFMAIAGFIGIFNWNYSRKKGYFKDHVTIEESLETVYKFYPEPIVAAITIPLAFIGSDWYMIGWLMLIPVTILMNKRKKKKIDVLKDS